MNLLIFSEHCLNLCKCFFTYQADIYAAVVGVGFLEEYMTEPTDGSNGFIDHKIRSQHRVSIHHL